MRVADEIDTKTAKAGDTFHGTTAAALSQGSYTVVPAGSAVVGRITDAKAAGRLGGAAELLLVLVSVRVAGSNGPQDASLLTQTLTGKTTSSNGGNGSGIDIGTNLFTHGKQIDIKPDQQLQFRTSAPLTVTIQLSDGKQVPPNRLPRSSARFHTYRGLMAYIRQNRCCFERLKNPKFSERKMGWSRTATAGSAVQAGRSHRASGA